MGKGDNKPRGRTPAFAFFVKACHAEHKKKHPKESVVLAEFSKTCADRWKTMSETEKQRFHSMAEKDRARYESEMANYKPVKGEKGSKRKRTKDPNAPKRSLSSFFLFSNDERPKVKESIPDSTVIDVAKELGRRWRSVSAETKAKYDEQAAKEKARYMKEMKAYKGNKKKDVDESGEEDE